MSARAPAIVLISLLAGCAAKPALRTPAAQRGLEVPADLRAAVALSETLGRTLYVQNKVSGIASEELLRHVRNPHGIRGYVPARLSDDQGRPLDSYTVGFFTGDDPPRVAYEVHVAENAAPVLESHRPPRKASEAFVRLARARQAALAAVPKGSQTRNSVLVQADVIGAKGVLVYLLAVTDVANVAVLGQHFRVLVHDDSAPPEVTPLSKTALEVDVRPPRGGEPVGIVVKHVVTDYPLETHVFVSLQFRMPVFVSTSRGYWRVDGARISFLGQTPPDLGS